MFNIAELHLHTAQYCTIPFRLNSFRNFEFKKVIHRTKYSTNHSYDKNDAK